MVTWLTVGHLISLEKATGTQLLATALATKMLQMPYLPKRCYHLKFGIKHNWKETSSEKFEIMINLSQHEAMNPRHFYDQSYPRQWRPCDPTTQSGSNHNEWIVPQLFNGRSWQIRWGVELLNSQGALSRTNTNHFHIVWALTLPHATCPLIICHRSGCILGRYSWRQL